MPDADYVTAARAARAGEAGRTEMREAVNVWSG